MKAQSPQEIIFVTGKGGVGKSAVAAGLALKKSQEGKKTLLIELGNQSFYKDFFELPEVAFKPTSLKPNLDVALWSGLDCLREYAIYLLKIESLYKLFFENTVSKTLLNVAPALPELSIMGKATSHPRQVGPALNYDCLVIDAFATGHFLALLRAPQGMAQAIRFGPMGEQSRGIDRVLRDRSQCQYFVVSLPEEMPVVEALELAQGIENLVGVKPLQLLNRFVQISDQVLDVTPSSENLKHFQEHIEVISARQKALLEDLSSGNAPVAQLPFIFSAKPWDIVSGIAKALP